MTEPEPAAPIFEQTSGTTQSAGQTIDEGKGRIFPCEGCGADLKFHIGQQQLKCPYCGFEKEIEIGEDAWIEEQDFRTILARMRELHSRDRHDEAEQNEVRCESFVGNVVFVGSLTSSECPYCTSPMQLENVHTAENRIPVDGVLPFLISKETSRKNLSEWVSSRWFAPNDFLKRGVEGRFNGIYLPYWTFDSLTATRYSGQRGEHYYVTVGSGKNKRRVRKTRWYSALGAFQRFFDDVLVLATTGMRHKLISNLEPWPLHKCVPFTQQVLAGYLGEPTRPNSTRDFSRRSSASKRSLRLMSADTSAATRRGFIQSTRDTTQSRSSICCCRSGCWPIATKRTFIKSSSTPEPAKCEAIAPTVGPRSHWPSWQEPSLRSLWASCSRNKESFAKSL